MTLQDSLIDPMVWKITVMASETRLAEHLRTCA